MRTRSYRREMRERVIRKRKAISKITDFTVEHDGMFSKGKVHCSCPQCTFSKFYGLTTLKEKKDREYVKSCLEDLAA